VVGFNAVLMSEHFGSFLVAAIMHGALAVRWVKSLLPPRQFEYATRLVLLGGACGLAGMVLLVLGYVLQSPTFGWTGEVRHCGNVRTPE
jgi:dolichyl-diphosphooligosaccharide--protein glycosyltransferase